MKKIWKWFMESNRYKHFLGGAIIGLFANSVYCAAYAGAGVAGALEYKDYLWGGKPDWVDFTLTVAGTTVGYLVRVGLISLLGL